MRTETHVSLDFRSLVPKNGAEPEEVARDLLTVLLTEERIVYPEDRPFITKELVLSAFKELQHRWSGKGEKLPTDPDSSAIAEAVEAAILLQPETSIGDARLSGIEDQPDLARRALKQAVSILAQTEDPDEATIDVRQLVHDRDNGVFGLLFQGGLTFTIRLRHRDPEKLKGATEKLVNACAPRAASELTKTIPKVKTLDKISRRLNVDLSRPVEMRTPAGELAQTGHIHAVRSQLGLLGFLALQTPQTYLIFLTLLLVAGDIVFKLGLVPDLNIRNASLGEFTADYFGRLSTGAFGAFLVALFAKFAEVRKNLRHGSGKGRRSRIAGAAYGAIIEWKTE